VASGVVGSVEAVLPSGPPFEHLVDQVLERDTADVVIEAPSRRDVADDEDSSSVPSRCEVVEESPDAGDRLPPALPARERLVDVRSSIASVRSIAKAACGGQTEYLSGELDQRRSG